MKYHRKSAFRKKVEARKLVDDGPVGASLQLVVVEQAAWNLEEALVRPEQ